MLKAVKRYLFATLLFLCAFSAGATGRPVVKAKLDSLNLVMGRMTSLQLTVEQPENMRGDFPLFRNIADKGYASVCNDSVELRAPVSADTVRSNGYMTVTMKVPVQAFDSGFYRLPEFVYVAGRDTVRSNSLALKVIPVNVSKDDPIDDYASLSDPEDSSFFDWVPDWLYDFWWLVLIILLAVAALVYLLRSYRKKGYLIPPKPQPTPYEIAMASLHALKEKKYWEQGMEREYYTELTDILRSYLYGRFGINAMEMTSRQILASLSRNPEIKDKRPMIHQILNMADFVKFAKVRPLPDDNVAAFDNALRFVEETKPLPPSEDEEEKNSDGKGRKAVVGKSGKLRKYAKSGKGGAK